MDGDVEVSSSDSQGNRGNALPPDVCGGVRPLVQRCTFQQLKSCSGSWFFQLLWLYRFGGEIHHWTKKKPQELGPPLRRIGGGLEDVTQGRSVVGLQGGTNCAYYQLSRSRWRNSMFRRQPGQVVGAVSWGQQQTRGQFLLGVYRRPISWSTSVLKHIS